MKKYSDAISSPNASNRRAFLKTAAVAAVALGVQTTKVKATPALPKVTIYHIEGRRSERVVWLMEELGLPYELVFKPGDLRASMDLAKTAHPMGMVPTVRIGDDVLVESGAILEYITTKYARGRLWVPTKSPDYAAHLLWMHYAEGSAATRIVTDYLLHTIKPEALTPIAKANINDTSRVMDMVEDHLSKHPYFGGADFTAADIMMRFPIKLTGMWGVDWSLYPHVGPWVESVDSRPGYKRMRAKALPNGELPSPILNDRALADTGKKK